ncbi:MAG: ABC transporter ATP-binding protein [Thermodesulfobacteriota bacterium]|nr:ABC transporter ATP-binding protein [Thermodesulfobacteriota bacterium]
MNSIELDHISKQYRIGQSLKTTMLREAVVNFLKQPLRKVVVPTIWALKDVSASVKEGEIVGIIGRNGAGKSTLLKILSKITYPTSGILDVKGRVASLLEVGTGFHEELTGKENIFLNGSILGMKKCEIGSKLDEIISFSGVETFIDTPIKRYSSGMRLRLGFAVAAHLSAEILLIDEVLAVGDAEFQKKCLKSMGELSGSGRTVLFVSHNMAAIENLCSRVVWIDRGEVRMDGGTAEVVKAYMTTFVGKTEAENDLSNFEPRTGSGDVRYTAIEFLDKDGSPREFTRCGDTFRVRLHFNATTPISSPHFGLELYTDTGTLITSMNTWSSGFEIGDLKPGDGFLDLEIESLNFMPSRYYVSLWISKVGLAFDRIDHCAIMDIEESDFYGTGRGLDKRLFGLVVLPCKWAMAPDPR